MKRISYCSGIAALVILAGCATVQHQHTVDWDSPAPYCDLCHSTLHCGHGFSDAPAYTGQWEFVSWDGKVTSGTWRHQKMMSVHHQTREGQEFATHDKKTGLLMLWWDDERNRPYILQEYLSGEEHGYYSCWHPTRQVQSMGILNHGRYSTVVFFEPDGKKAEVHFRCDDRDHVTSYVCFPKEGRSSVFNFPADGGPYVEVRTNIVERAETPETPNNEIQPIK